MRHVAVMVVVLLMEETEGAAKVGPAPEWSILPSRDVVASRAIDDLVCCLQNPKHCLFSHAWALVSISLRTTKETPQEECASDHVVGCVAVGSLLMQQWIHP